MILKDCQIYLISFNFLPNISIIAKKFELTIEPWLLGVELFKEETGIEIRPQKAKNQIGKLTSINGELYKTKQ